MAIEGDQLKVSGMVETEQGAVWDKIGKLSLKDEQASDSGSSGAASEDGSEWSDGGAGVANFKKMTPSLNNIANNPQLNNPLLANTNLTPDVCKADISPKKSLMASFNDFICNKVPSMLNRLKNFKLKFDRKLNLNLDKTFTMTVCGKEKKLNLMDAVMKASEIIRKNPGLLSGDKDAMLNALLKSDILAKMNILGLGATIPTCILRKTVGSLYGQSDTGLGPSLRSRNALKELMYSDPCSAMFANNPLISSWLSNNAAAQIISTLMSNNPDKAFSLVDSALGIFGQRDSVLGGLMSSLAYAYDYNTRNKVDVLDRIWPKLTGQDIVQLRTDSSTILKKLDEEKEKNNIVSKKPSEDFNKYTNVISKLDPTWNYNNNYSGTKGNNTLSELSNQVLKDTVDPIDLSGVYKTVLKPQHYIAIINKFNKTLCEC